MTGPAATDTLLRRRQAPPSRRMQPRARSGPRAVVAAALRHPRYEVIPLSGIDEAVVATVPPDVTLTVTASPTRGLEATLDLAERLAASGYEVAPHLAARLVVDRSHLAELVDRLRAAAIRDVFVVAGDAPEPAGIYPGALDLLRELDGLAHPFDQVGITGYPESHPFISDDLTIQAMWDKHRFATYVVGQACFDPQLIAIWVHRVRARGVTLPIHLGVPGVADRVKLLRVAARIGLGDSSRFLRRHGNWAWRLLAPGAYRPDRLLVRTTAALRDDGHGIGGIHVFTFNEVAATEAWRQALLARLDGRPEPGAEGRSPS